LSSSIFLLILFLTIISIYQIIYISDKTKKYTYREIGVELFSSFSTVFEIPWLVFGLGACIIYIIIVNRTLSSLISIIFADLPKENHIYFTIGSILIMFLISLPRKMVYISFISYFVVAVILYLTTMIFVKFFVSVSKNKIKVDKFVYFDSQGLFFY
jgi:hypothetical protein